MGNTIKENKYNKLIDFTIKLDKICYFPGEYISGTLYIKGKAGLLETKLTDPKVKIEVNEALKLFPIKFSTVVSNPPEILNNNSNYLMFNTFIGANLLQGLNIPFRYQIPHSFNPTCRVLIIDKNNVYLMHYISVEFPSLKVKRTLPIVIKNVPNFTLQNGLYKSPLTFCSKKSKSILLVNKGEFTIRINLPKNVFYYDEKIPYEINLDLRNLHFKIKNVEVSLFRTIIKKNNIFMNSDISCKGEIAKNAHGINNESKEIVIANKIEFPKNLKDNSIFPPLFYETVEKGGYSFFDKLTSNDPNYKGNKLGNVSLYIVPSCKGNVLLVEYSLKIKLKFSNSSDEIFFIPIDFCLKPDNNEANNYNLEQINSFNNMNNNMNYNMNNNMNKYFIFNYNNNNNNNISNNNYNNNFNNNDYNSNINNNINNNFNNNNINNNQQYYNQSDEGYSYIKPQFDENKVLPNTNNLNILPQNQIFGNDNENMAPPPVLNNNNSESNKNKNVYGFEIIDHNNL